MKVHTSSPSDTRERIIFAAAEEFRERGFQSASIRRILDRTGVTKGALYHYFPSKLALGYAVVDELTSVPITLVMAKLNEAVDPLGALQEIVRGQIQNSNSSHRHWGCMLHQLNMEMALIDEGFAMRLDALLLNLHGTLSRVLKKAQENGMMRRELDPEGVAGLFMASRNGLLVMARCCPHENIVQKASQSLIDNLEMMRCPKAHPTTPLEAS